MTRILVKGEGAPKPQSNGAKRRLTDAKFPKKSVAAKPPNSTGPSSRLSFKTLVVTLIPTLPFLTTASFATMEVEEATVNLVSNDE